MRDVLGLMVAAVVACLTFLLNLIFLLPFFSSTGPLQGDEIAVLTIIVLWVFTTPIAAAVFTIRLFGQKERLCDVCGKYIPNDAVDWMQRIGEDGEALLWVPTHVDCSTQNHRIP